LTAIYNDINSVYQLVEENKDSIAAIIIEPIAGNMGTVPARPEFNSSLRELCTNEKIVLIFDEVMTGFRVAKGGAQEIYGVKPDLTTLGKIIGGGLPVGAYGGKKELMNLIAPAGPVYQAGTLSGNPLAMTAGYETLKIIDKDKNFYKKLNKSCEYLYEGIRSTILDLGLKYTFNTAGSMFTLFFAGEPVYDYNSAKKSDTAKFSKYHQSVLTEGVYLPPSQFEACFVSSAHTKSDFNRTIKSIDKTLRSIS
jgi:glutamate-1-semialdehyde 2,1-aminomutase